MKENAERGDRDGLLDRIAVAIKKSGVSGTAALEGSRLTQYWIEELAKFDAQYPTIGVEMPFFIILEKYTVVVGMQDRIAMDGAGVFGCEWKTTKGTTRYWNEEKWIEQIKNSAQLKTYGLGQHEGYFIPGDQPFNAPGNLLVGEMGGPTLWHPEIKFPRILVRAITKEDPPNLWGVDPPAFFEIDKKSMDMTREAYLIKADQIRAARNRKNAPWQIVGQQCMDRYKFGEFCRFHESCLAETHPIAEILGGGFNEDDPGGKAIKAAQSLMRVPLNDPRVVILSASAYSDATDCMEKYRRTAIEGSEENPEMDKGTALHAGVAEFYRVAR
jgi:hypothetical protein